MDPHQEAVLRKIALRLVPLLTLAFVVNYLDRTNIAVAALAMNQDLGLSATEFGLGAGILFAGYTTFEIPSNLALYRFGARRWIARIMITWGLVSIATALVYDANTFYAARFLLGIAEAGFFPGVTYYLTVWFPPQYRARMLAWFLVGVPLSTAIGSPISGLLLEMNGVLGLRGWQWLFIIEGLPAVVLGIIALYALADRPETAAWLAPKERRLLENMLGAERRERPKSNLMTALADWRVILLALIQFGFTLGSYGTGIFLPQIVKGFGLTNLVASVLSAVPYVFASGRNAVVGLAGRADRREHCQPCHFLRCRDGRACPLGRCREPRRGARRAHPRARRHHRGPRDLLADPDPLPHRSRRRRWPCLHQFNRRGRGFCRTLSDGMAARRNRLLRGGARHHGGNPAGDEPARLVAQTGDKGRMS